MLFREEGGGGQPRDGGYLDVLAGVEEHACVKTLCLCVDERGKVGGERGGEREGRETGGERQGERD